MTELLQYKLKGTCTLGGIQCTPTFVGLGMVMKINFLNLHTLKILRKPISYIKLNHALYVIE